MNITPNELRRLKETVEVLAGERGDPRKAAIRMGTLGALQSLIAELKNADTSSEGTLAEMNLTLSETRRQLGDVQSSVSGLVSDLSELSSGSAQALQKIQGELLSAQQSIGTVQQEIGIVQQGISGLQADNDALGQQLAALIAASAAVSIPEPQQGEIEGTPTAGDFNALVQDLAGLFQVVTDLKNAIGQ